MDFSNFKTITINGQEVKQLAIDGDVVWVKPSEIIPASISLSVDNPVIMTGETATLSALVLDADGNPCPGVTVSFSSDIPNSTIYHTITNNDGIAQMLYDSESIGDVQFTATINGLNSSLTIQDYIHCSLGSLGNTDKWSCQFNSNTYDGILGMTNTNIGNILNLDLPSEFTIKYKMYPSTSSVSDTKARLIMVGTDANNGYLIGNNAGYNAIAIYKRENGTNTLLKSLSNGYTDFAWNEFTITVTKNSITLKCGSQEITAPLSIDVGDYVAFYAVNSDSWLADFKIKPLVV